MTIGDDGVATRDNLGASWAKGVTDSRANLPCRFCGATNLTEYVPDLGEWIECGGCGAVAQKRLWNTTPTKDSAALCCEQLRQLFQEHVCGVAPPTKESAVVSPERDWLEDYKRVVKDNQDLHNTIAGERAKARSAGYEEGVRDAVTKATACEGGYAESLHLAIRSGNQEEQLRSGGKRSAANEIITTLESLSTKPSDEALDGGMRYCHYCGRTIETQ